MRTGTFDLRSAALLLALTLLGAPANGERLPLRRFGVADGLARDSVSAIDRDRRGFLWFSTEEGLSLYDGTMFANFGKRDGLPSDDVVGVRESSDGRTWIVTSGGVSRLERGAFGRPGFAKGDGPSFTPFASPPELGRLQTAVASNDGGLWCGAFYGVAFFQPAGERGSWRIIDLGIPASQAIIHALATDASGHLWIGSEAGLFVLSPGGSARRWSEGGRTISRSVSALLLDRAGRLWVGNPSGLVVIDAARGETAPVVREFSSANGLRFDDVQAIFEDDSGRIWVGASGGLARLDEKTGWRIWTIEDLDVPSGAGVYALGQDPAGNLWLATGRAGIVEIVDDRMTTYSDSDGLPMHGLDAIVLDRKGRVCVSLMDQDRGIEVGGFGGGRFTVVKPNLGARRRDVTWGEKQVTFQDRNGRWWVPTSRGVARFPPSDAVEKLASLSPESFLGRPDGLAADIVFRLFEDARGDVWISSIGRRSGLERWDHATGRIVSYSERDGLPSRKRVVASAFREDRAGDLWIGTHNGGVLRFRGGRFESFTDSGTLLGQWIEDLFVDGVGRLWISTSHTGLRRVDDPSAAEPRFVRFGKSDGLSSDTIYETEQDAWERFYVGTGRGVDRFRLASEGLTDVEHFTTGDGLPCNEVEMMARDGDGRFWFGCGSGGVAAFVPDPPNRRRGPPIRITSLTIDGARETLGARGLARLSGITLGPGRHTLILAVSALSFFSGQQPRYEMRLEKGGSGSWSAPGGARTFTLAGLAPGAYRISARALAADGTPSPEPAVLQFRILTPPWRRPESVAAAIALLAAALAILHRQRVARLLELERVRLQISSDLHDDIGTSLSRVAIMSEVIRQQSSVQGSSPIDDKLTEIAETAREVVASMSDVVWANDPRRDDAGNLVARLCAFAADVMDGRAIAWHYSGPPDLDRVRLRPEVRRQIYLILKEAIANAARHSGAASASLTVGSEEKAFQAVVEDDGRGFCAGEPRSPFGGRGLGSMAERARTIGARLDVESVPGSGTRISLSVPLA